MNVRASRLHHVRIREVWYLRHGGQGDGEGGTKRLAELQGMGLKARISKANGEAGHAPIVRTVVSASGHRWGLVHSARSKRRRVGQCRPPVTQMQSIPCGEGVK